jgi:hypothetical protein
MYGVGGQQNGNRASRAVFSTRSSRNRVVVVFRRNIDPYLSYLVSKSAAVVIDQRFKVNSAKYPQGRQVYFDVWCWWSAKRVQGLQGGFL